MAVAFLGAGSVGDLVLQTISIGHLVALVGEWPGSLRCEDYCHSESIGRIDHTRCESQHRAAGEPCRRRSSESKEGSDARSRRLSDPSCPKPQSSLVKGSELVRRFQIWKTRKGRSSTWTKALAGRCRIQTEVATVGEVKLDMDTSVHDRETLHIGIFALCSSSSRADEG